MEKLANRIAESVAHGTGLDEERKRVVAYGLGALIQMLFLLIVSMIFGLLFHCLVEALIVFFAVGLFKGAMGGAHSSTSESCTCISLVSIFVMALAARYVVPAFHRYWPYYLAFATLAFAVTFVIAYKRAPVASAHKPITQPEKRKRLRVETFTMIALGYVLAAVMIGFSSFEPRLINAAVSLSLAALWQGWMLTNSAARFISCMDLST